MKAFVRVLLLIILLLLPCFAFADLSVYFLDVGQADAIFINADGHSMIIDGGNASDSQLIYSFLSRHCSSGIIDYAVATHPHEDHIGGLPAAFKVCQVNTLFTPFLEYDSTRFTKLISSATASGSAILQPNVGQIYTLGNAEFCFYSPLLDYEDTNNCSLVMKLTYGMTSFLFTGDAEFQAEDDMVCAGWDLSADVLKVGHHGSSTSTLIDFLSAVYPQYAVISVGTDNQYKHPADDTMYYLEYYGICVYRTDYDGTILFQSDGFDLTVTAENDLIDIEAPQKPTTSPSVISTAVPAQNPTDSTLTYIGNKKSKKFHYPSCSGVATMSEKNKVVLYSRDEAIDLGYSPCGSCQP